MTYNAASRKHIRAAEKSQVVISTIDREVIAGLMSVKNGRHWIHEQLARSSVFATDAFALDPYHNAFIQGQRAAGIRLFNDLILYAPDNFILMIKEAHERAITDAIRRDTADRTADGDTDATDEYGRWIDPSDAAEGAQPTQ